MNFAPRFRQKLMKPAGRAVWVAAQAWVVMVATVPVAEKVIISAVAV